MKDGPVIPFPLLQSLEDGELIVFCGAGVSCRLGLPHSKGLTAQVFSQLGAGRDTDLGFDVAFGQLESKRLGFERRHVRRAVREVLEIKEGADFSSHQALLRLATSRRGLRLVTTNFDTAFEKAAYEFHRTIYYPPCFPIPKRDWSGIVNLHGGLGDEHDPDGDSLVLTTADFGRAYLTEGWARRFLTEIFRQSDAVLFVGYSVEDPAVRYIVDFGSRARSGCVVLVATGRFSHGIRCHAFPRTAQELA